jgi:hypothetical protein
MLNYNGLITDAENLCAEVRDAILKGVVEQAVKHALEARVTAVSTGVSTLENAEGLEATLEAAASLTEATGALAGEAAAAGIVVA